MKQYNPETTGHPLKKDSISLDRFRKRSGYFQVMMQGLIKSILYQFRCGIMFFSGHVFHSACLLQNAGFKIQVAFFITPTPSS